MDKPDFEQLLRKIGNGVISKSVAINMCEHVWNTHVVPLQEALEIVSKDLSDSLYDEHLLQNKVKDLRAIIEKRTKEYFDIKSENKALQEKLKVSEHLKELADDAIASLREEIDRLKGTKDYVK